MEKQSGSAKQKLKKEKDISNTENVKYILKTGNFFTLVNVSNCSAKVASVNEDSSDKRRSSSSEHYIRYTLKSLSTTRWSCRADSTKAENDGAIRDTLANIA